MIQSVYAIKMNNYEFNFFNHQKGTFLQSQQGTMYFASAKSNFPEPYTIVLRPYFESESYKDSDAGLRFEPTAFFHVSHQ